MATRNDYRNLYKSKRWHRLKHMQLNKQPMCQCPYCGGKGCEADIVDHIIPHKGDKRLFFDPKNLQSLAKVCHDGMKQRMEKRGDIPGCNPDGSPLDPRQSW